MLTCPHCQQACQGPFRATKAIFALSPGIVKFTCERICPVADIEQRPDNPQASKFGRQAGIAISVSILPTCGHINNSYPNVGPQARQNPDRR